ncbi:MAG: hypothetical protein ACKESB_01605 [Candidatus Hodgkinia cicadicola]
MPYAASLKLQAALVHTSNLAEEVISVSWLSSCAAITAVIEAFGVAVTFRNVADKASALHAAQPKLTRGVGLAASFG